MARLIHFARLRCRRSGSGHRDFSPGGRSDRRWNGKQGRAAASRGNLCCPRNG